jgi:hypothetical protein
LRADDEQLVSWAFAIPGENLNFWVADDRGTAQFLSLGRFSEVMLA